MYRLLNITEKRQLDTLKILIFSEQWHSFQKISKELQCDLKTVEGDLKNLELVWGQKVPFDFSKNKGVRLWNEKGIKISDFFSEIFKNNLYFRLISSVFFHPFESVQKIGERIHLSKSSTYRVINEMNQQTKKDLGFFIRTNPGRLMGEKESSFRMQMTSFFEQAYLLDEWPFPEINKKKLIELIFELGDKLAIPMYACRVHRISIMIAITLYRMQHGFSLEKELLETEDDTYEEYFLTYKKNYQEITSFPLKEKWYKEIARFVFMTHYGWKSKEEQYLVEESIRESVELVSKKLNLPIQPKEKDNVLMEFKYLYVEYSLHPNYRLTIYRECRGQVKRLMKQYPFFMREITEQLKHLEIQLNFPCYSLLNYEAIWSLILGWTDLILLLSQSRPQAKIYVISSQGLSHAKMLQNLIRDEFLDGVKVECSERFYLEVGQEMLRKEIGDNHLVVSTHGYAAIPQEKLIVVDDIPSNEQLQKLREKVEILRNELALSGMITINS